jgi:hypothetical protein
MKKLNNMIALLLKGQTTDSGGGGVLESLAKQLKKRGICTPIYLVASCMLHAIRIALANPVKSSLGACTTMMQMLHSACHLQKSVEFSGFRLAMEEVQQWVEQKQNDCFPPDRYDPKIKYFSVDTWNRRVNEFALPQAGRVMNSPTRFKRSPSPSCGKMVVCWSSHSIPEEVSSHCVESNPDLHQYQ